MKSIKLSKIVRQAALHALTMQAADGSFPPGHNGRYYDPETPVRNTAHWLYLLAHLYLETGELEWKVAGEKAVDYLTGPEARPYGKSFYCREKRGKDKCNGLVGQAWVVEALVKAADAFGFHDCYSLAEEVVLLHSWNPKVGLWRRVEVDGTSLSFDGTFNHQLWFAAAAGLLKNTPLAQKQAKLFLEKVAAQVQLYPNGVIFHTSAMGQLTDYLESGTKPFLRELKSRLRNVVTRDKLYSKSVGYHGFNLYAFAMLKESFPGADFWKTDIFKAILWASTSLDFVNDLKSSEFSYRYNISGIEIAYAVETFFQDTAEARKWLNRQMDETYLCKEQCLSREAFDPNTAMARIYQAARLKEDYELVARC